MTPYAEPVLIGHLWEHREHDRSDPALVMRTPAQMAALAASIAADGITEPLLLHYDPLRRLAMLGEGNHRIVLARQAGLLAVPVVGTYIAGMLDRRARPGHAVAGAPRLRPKVPDGYFPSVFRPSLVLPSWYFAEPPARLVPFLDVEACLA